MTNCLFLSGEGVLKCRCSPCHANAVNDTCIAKFQCFTGLRLVVENGEQVEIISMGCMSEEENSILQVREIISQYSNMIRNIFCISLLVFFKLRKIQVFCTSWYLFFCKFKIYYRCDYSQVSIKDFILVVM